MDWVMRRTVKSGENGIRSRLTSKLDDLDFADDVALLSSTKQHIQNKTTRMNKEARRFGLMINNEPGKEPGKDNSRWTEPGKDNSRWTGY